MPHRHPGAGAECVGRAEERCCALIFLAFDFDNLASEGVRTLEVYTTATLAAMLDPAAPVRPEWRAAMDRLAAAAQDSFRRVVYEDPRFPAYFRAVTPEQWEEIREGTLPLPPGWTLEGSQEISGGRPRRRR